MIRNTPHTKHNYHPHQLKLIQIGHYLRKPISQVIYSLILHPFLFFFIEAGSFQIESKQSRWHSALRTEAFLIYWRSGSQFCFADSVKIIMKERKAPLWDNLWRWEVVPPGPQFSPMLLNDSSHSPSLFLIILILFWVSDGDYKCNRARCFICTFCDFSPWTDNVCLMMMFRWCMLDDDVSASEINNE